MLRCIDEFVSEIACFDPNHPSNQPTNPLSLSLIPLLSLLLFLFWNSIYTNRMTRSFASFDCGPQMIRLPEFDPNIDISSCSRPSVFMFTPLPNHATLSILPPNITSPHPDMWKREEAMPIIHNFVAVHPERKETNAARE